MQNDTIAAISTPHAKGGIGIIRISGALSRQIAERIFDRPINKSHTIRYGFILDPKTNQKIDEVLLTFMEAPRTYTMEDIVEINCHSGIAVLSKIMEIVLENGARLAQSGEFTKRAFLNGRIDLSQAEAVADIISAKTELARQSAVCQLSGRLYDDIKSFMDRILLCLSNIEAEIEYPEHFENEEQTFFLIPSITGLLEDARKLYETSDIGRLIKEGINTVIIGETNVGKSSLLNYLAGSERAIVTDIHGTTRDIIEETVNMGGLLLRISDTAGIRGTNDPVEKIGVKKALAAAKDADLILYVFDAAKSYKRFLISNKDTKGKIIAVINKIDLGVSLDAVGINEAFGRENVIFISIKTGEGISQLVDRIKKVMSMDKYDPYENSAISNLRHKDALYRAIESLESCLNTIRDGFPADIASVDLSNAYECLGEITGNVVSEDLTDKIFSEFCLGK